MNFDIRIISALIGALAIIISALLSYFISKRTKDEENAIAYLKGKITALEEEKYILVGMEFKPIEGNITSENLIDKLYQSLSKQFNTGAESFRRIDHYLPSSRVQNLNDQVKKINLALGAVGIENIAGRKLPKELIDDVPRDEELRQELTTFFESVIQAINDELKKSIGNLERLSNLRK